MDIPKTYLYEDIHKGLINVTFHKGRMRISFREMREYAFCNGTELWHLPELGEYGYVGMAFKDIAKSKKAPYCHGLQPFCHNYHGYDGALYIAPSVYMETRMELLEFVARNLFRYNQLMMRRRPFSKRRFLFLCYTDDKTKKKADEIAESVNHKFPGVARVEPFEYAHRVSSRSI